ncbi:hypothetical protein KEM54_001173 [Ascosphaera aggregata]|nr:hypothetical protein KEM54_001173 [Ascosphaera aggregata]
MDSYNLAWKLAYAVHGLTSDTAASADRADPLLETYHTERHAVAQQLIDFDRVFSSMFSGKISIKAKSGLSHDEFLRVFSEGIGFTSGCGIEYPVSHIVSKEYAKNPVTGNDYLSGILRPGRRLLDVRVKRQADGRPYHIQDDFPSNGRFRILCLTSDDVLDCNGTSSRAINALNADILETFPSTLLELVVLHPQLPRTFHWHEINPIIKQRAEMTFHGPLDDAYTIYGVSPKTGALPVIRPDGYIGVLATLDDTERVKSYIARCIRPAQDFKH